MSILIQKRFWKAAFAADTATGNCNIINTILTDGFNIFFIIDKPVLSNGPRVLTKNSNTDCPILDNWLFENVILADEPFAKTLQFLETRLLVDDSLCEQLAWSL